jgi:hypothetical protein
VAKAVYRVALDFHDYLTRFSATHPYFRQTTAPSEYYDVLSGDFVGP